MIFRYINLAFLSVVLAFGTASTTSSEFKALFNGKSLSGWVNVMGAHDSWTVGNSLINTTGSPKSVLRTDKQYENYVLELEYKKPMSFGLAGIIIHSDALPAVGMPWPRGINIQFWNSGNGIIQPIGGAKMQTVDNPPEPEGGGESGEVRSSSNGEDGWHHVRIESREGSVTLRVNGKLVALGAYSLLRKGYIALKSDGAEVQFRNIRIHELPSSNPTPDQIATKDRGFTSLYNGVDLEEHWELSPGHRGHWTAEDWVINYDGRSEERRKSLWSKKEFGDFVLIADMKFTGEPEMAESPVVLPGGDNLKNADGSNKMVVVPYAGDTGIYVRGSSKNQVNMGNRFIGSGEIYGYRADGNMPAEVRKAVVPKVNADNPPGEWNRYIITMKGDRISVELNGYLVIDNALLPGVARNGKIALQDDHAYNNLFKFANLYIKELD